MKRVYSDRDRTLAVQAREKIRMAEPDFSGETRRKIRAPRGRVRFTLTLEDHQIGDKIRLGLFALPWRGRFVSTDGQQLSAAKICTMVNTTLNFNL
jgi:hypothetical protein